MAYKKIARISADSEIPMGACLYQADAEADLASVPEDGQFCIVLSHDADKSVMRSRNSSGVWTEVK